MRDSVRTDADTRNPRPRAQAALVVGALGVVFGDIGTSPLYTVQTVFNPSDPHPVAATTDSVFGIISLIFWSVTIIVTRHLRARSSCAPTTTARAASWR